MNSTEARTNAIQNLYQTILGRAADTSGLTFWLGYMNDGHIIEDIKAGFYGSQEYFDSIGDSNSALVQAYYQAFLGRSAESGGLVFWTNQLDQGAGHSVVAREIMTLSTEGARVIVNHAYTTYLHRSPDSGGLNYWIGKINGGASEMQIIAGFLGSVEYFNLV
jgi:hypothetical protein